ncbi:MAG: ribosome biogenesis GTPase Der [Terriglobales bacterium]
MSSAADVAIVGRPNVGKSTLFNRLTRSRRAIVGNEPGITRDRIAGVSKWRGRSFTLVDTGGLLPGEEAEIPTAVLAQAEAAMAAAQVVLVVVDGREELTAADLELSQKVRCLDKPVLLLVNKLEGQKRDTALGPFYRLGQQEIFPVSAETGSGLDAVLDRVTELLEQGHSSRSSGGGKGAAGDDYSDSALGPEAAPSDAETAAETRVAIVGHPNVGKSTLLNQLTGETRVIVSAQAGTTRDAVDALIEYHGARYRLVDTAGIRRKGATRLLAEKLSVVMARKHLEAADVALILLDAAEAEEGGVLALDATIAGYAVEAHRSCVLVANKWDRARALGRTRSEYEQRVRERLKFLAFAPLVFLSAREGTGLRSLYATLGRVVRARRERVSTAALNRFLATVDFARAPVPAGQRSRILYMTQVGTAPPRFALFLDRARPLHFSYRRFLENQMRRSFGFEGTPLVLQPRARRRHN